MSRLGWVQNVATLTLFGATAFLYNELETLKTDVSSQNLALRVENSALRSTLEDINAELATVVAKQNDQSSQTETLETKVKDLSTEAAKSATNAITTQIIEIATEQAISEAVAKLLTAEFDKLLVPLAAKLVELHGEALTGPPGKDADSERVASFLLAQPEFLDAVSLSVIDLTPQ
jgi:septal ring factor EnvC (AmiA/AmiB activator)